VTSGDARRHWPAAERNKGPILEVLRRVLPGRGLVLEIAAGTGQHTAHFAGALPSLEWQPTEFDASMLPSIEAWCAGLANVRKPIALDVGKMPWPVGRADAILCVNMIHISPWQATLDLFAGAKTTLGPGGVLFLYGPYRRFGAHTAPSNETFDEDLRSRNPEWGVRDLEAVEAAARNHGFSLDEIVAMPANNFSVIFRMKM
jgi:SAM-dependent methyltransferase